MSIIHTVPLKPNHLDPLRQRVRNGEPAETLSEQVPLEREVRECEAEDQTPTHGVVEAHALRRDVLREGPGEMRASRDGFHAALTRRRSLHGGFEAAAGKQGFEK